MANLSKDTRAETMQRGTHLVSIADELLGDFNELADFVRHDSGVNERAVLASVNNMDSHGTEHVTEKA